MAAAFAVSVSAVSSPVAAQDRQSGSGDPGGMLKAMPQGTYQCALPGDAGGKAFLVQKDEQFHVGPSFSYRSERGNGTYILRGDRFAFTSGPKKGERLQRIGTNQLKRGDMICTRLSGSA